jgi:hypothetical protein
VGYECERLCPTHSHAIWERFQSRLVSNQGTKSRESTVKTTESLLLAQRKIHSSRRETRSAQHETIKSLFNRSLKCPRAEALSRLESLLAQSVAAADE